MIHIIVHGIRNKEDADKICVWFALNRPRISERLSPNQLIVSVPWQEGCGLVEGAQLTEIFYDRSFQREVRYQLVPWLMGCNEPNDIKTPWHQTGIILNPMGEYIHISG